MARLNVTQIAELLATWDADKVIELHNTFCEINNSMEDYVYQNTEENMSMFLPSSPYDAFISGLQAGDAYYTSDEYFYINGYGNIVSFSDPVEKDWIIDDLARWLESNNHQAEWLELDEDDEEEEEQEEEE